LGFQITKTGIGEMIVKFEKLISMIKGDARYKDCVIDADITEDGVVTLSGMADTWRNLVGVGLMAGKQPETTSVCSRMTAKDVPAKTEAEKSAAQKLRSEQIKSAQAKGLLDEADVVIIGAGVAGCAIARELARYQLKIVVTEKASDVSEGASKANNGHIHPGHKATPGTLKAKLNVRGNAMYDQWAEELGFDLVRCGQLNVAHSEADMDKLKKYYQDGLANDVPGLRMITSEEVLEMEPEVPGVPAGGLHIPTMAVVEPYQVCVALAENAVRNGVTFYLSNEVLDVEVKNGRVCSVLTERGTIRTKLLINAAGIYADEIAAMAQDAFYTLRGRRGGLLIFDAALKSPYSRSVSTVASGNDANSKGGGFSTTPAGNLMVGPSAVETPYKEDLAVLKDDIDYAFDRGVSIWPELKRNAVIAMYAGNRAASFTEDFISRPGRATQGIVHVAGIQSPGLASAPAIAEMAVGIALALWREICGEAQKRTDFDPCRPAPVRFKACSDAEKDRLINADPAYGNIICRCETISEGEILEALSSPIAPTTIDAIKRRTRAGMGRCQGGFCQPKVVEIIARELGVDWTEILQKGRKGQVLVQGSRHVAKETKAVNG
jgi:glycerol-3-phosphate dehydrogenase